jgi:hypothetical protein
MQISALSLPLPMASGSTLRTVAQSPACRNWLIALVGIVSCVINGDSLSGILEQATWLVAVVVILVVARTGEALVQQRAIRSARPETSGD